MPDYTVYQPPGVTISEDLSPILAPTGSAGTVIAILGPGIGYKSATDQVPLVGTTPVLLGTVGVIPASVVVTDVAGNLLDPSTYTLTVAAGADGNIGITQDNTLTIARNGSTIPDGSTVFATYRYQDTTYYSKTVVEDFDTVASLYGAPFHPTTGALQSPLSLAAYIAFQNGARQMVLVATPTPAPGAATTQADLLAAYAKIATDYSINIVVPLPYNIVDAGIGAIASDLKNHVNTCSNDGYFRIGIIGGDTTLTGSPDTQLAGPVSTKRVVVVAPNKLNYYVGQLNQTIVIGGLYLAAGAAGVLASRRVQDPLTKKVIDGFSGLPTTMSNAVKNTITQGGVSVAEINRNSQLTIRHGRTTDNSNVTTREISMVRAKDDMVIRLQTSVDAAAMVGTPIDINTPVVIKGLVASVLETCVTDGVITGYSGLQARQQIYANGDPTIIEVKFAYAPTYPLNYINVSFSVDLSSGTSSLTDITNGGTTTTSSR